ncbi:MAG: hypothetical protein HY976_04190 [Candidatus Kerfeldbacteria bacterium]|nr:hypothetical protein [Candidatus Kerfeldbacteria bacterium]
MSGRPAGTFATLALRAVLAISLIAGPLVVSGAIVSISAVVQDPTPPPPPPTKVIFKGLAYPNSQVTIQKEAAVLATVPADPAAKFEVETTGHATGIYTFSVFAEDVQGRVGRTTNFTLSITQGTTTTVSGIFLGPTIDLDKTAASLGDTITVIGATAPLSAVTIMVSSEVERTFSATADADGLWVKQLIANDLGIGSHYTRAKSVSPSSEISGFSNTVSFSITAAAPQPCDGKRPGDLNCDGKVNITDFSILLFYWKKSNPANARVDINADGIVNIKDLSIMLFWWTG